MPPLLHIEQLTMLASSVARRRCTRALHTAAVRPGRALSQPATHSQATTMHAATATTIVSALHKSVQLPPTRLFTTINAYNNRIPQSLRLIGNALNHLNNTAIVGADGKTHTYQDLLNDSIHLSNVLLSKLAKDGQNDLQEQRISFLLQPGYQYVVLQWAIWLAGGVVVPLHHSLPQPQIEYIVQDSQSSLLISESKFEKLVGDISKSTGVEHQDLNELLSAQSNINDRQSAPKITPKRRAQLIYTSGTTGKPKGVVSTHSNIDHQARSLVEAWEWSDKDHILHNLPLHHTHGIINALICPLYAGAKITFLTKFDPAVVWQKFIDLDDLTVYTAVPTIYSKLIEYYNQQSKERQQELSQACSKFRLMMCGSAALPESVLHQWKKISGHTLLERYGMTETGMTLSNPLHGERKVGYVGKALPYVETKVQPLEDEDSKLSSSGVERGQLLVAGPAVFTEYWNLPEATQKEFTSDGKWFKTGDVVEKNQQGEFKIVGRASVDIIKSAGNKISALAIEQTLLEHPDIDEVAVVGIPDEEYGQLIGVLAKLNSGSKLDLDTLRKWCKNKLQVSEQPRKLLILDEIPRNAMGKINKKQLVKKFEE